MKKSFNKINIALMAASLTILVGLILYIGFSSNSIAQSNLSDTNSSGNIKIVLINNTSSKKDVFINESQIALDRFEIQTEILNIFDGKILVKDINGLESEISIDTNSEINFSRENTILVNLDFSTESCFVKTTISSLYYQTENPQNEFSNNLFKKQNYFIVERDSRNQYVYPGNTELTDTNFKISPNSSVFGIFPIVCSDIENTEQIKNVAYYFINYNSQMLQNIYLEEENRINLIN